MAHTQMSPDFGNRNAETTGKAHSIRLLGVLAAVLLLVALVAAGAMSFASRLRDRKVLAAETEKLAVPTVAVVHASVEAAQEDVQLPGTLQAFTESPIYARTSGYLLRWHKDIGSPVSKGELLAEIDTPEVDQELMQARAGLEQTRARAQLARISADRYQNLRATDSVSQQEADERASALQQSQADLAAVQANVRRLEQLESFKRVYAPFSGVLTKRLVDTGALINAGNGGANRELFDIAQIDVLRVYVAVPQTYSPLVHSGMRAYLTMAEFTGQKFEGRVARTSEAIDPATRTLLTEIDVPNKSGRLLPGSYVQVHFDVKAAARRLVLPVNALLFRAEGPRAAVVTAEGKVELRALVIGRDYGSTVEILGGIDAADSIILNPPDSLEDGQTVRVAGAQGQR